MLLAGDYIKRETGMARDPVVQEFAVANPDLLAFDVMIPGFLHTL